MDKITIEFKNKEEKEAFLACLELIGIELEKKKKSFTNRYVTSGIIKLNCVSVASPPLTTLKI